MTASASLAPLAPGVLTPRGAAAPAADPGFRVLVPYAFDVLSRVMDSNVVSVWWWLTEVCDVVLWGPGVRGFRDDRPLDEVARDVDADVVLLPDWHGTAPDVLDTVWRGVERCAVPVVWYVDDHAAHLHVRERILRTARPAGVIFNGATGHLAVYEPLRRQLGFDWLVVPRGVDLAQFSPPPPGAPRDIDLLVCGAEEPPEVYPIRRQVKRVARRLADRLTVVDLAHPGYWEVQRAAAGRGQAAFADLLRRSRLVTTGTAYGKLASKYAEAAACGAICLGDVPPGEPAADRFLDASLVVEPGWDDDRVAREIEALLRDPARCAALSARAVAAVAGDDHRDRARDYLDVLVQIAERERRTRPRRPRRPRPTPAPAPAALVAAAPEPGEVPTPRADWASAWTAGAPGASRTRRLEALLAARAEDVAVVALDPEGARSVDALLLAEAVRETGGVALRPARDPRPGEDPLLAPWSAVAAPRAALVAALSAERGRSGPERALLALADAHGAQVLPAGGYADPCADVLLLDAALHARPGAALPVAAARAAHAEERARREGRERLAAQLAGWRTSVVGGPLAPPTPASAAPAAPPQDPELEGELPAGSCFLALDPRDADAVRTVAAHAVRGEAAPTLALGIPLRTGLLPDEAGELLVPALVAAGVDLDACADLVVLERPLWDAELAWLGERLPAPAAG